jgi:hypothetical protein
LDQMGKRHYESIMELTQMFGRQRDLASRLDREARMELPLAAGLALGRFAS